MVILWENLVNAREKAAEQSVTNIKLPAQPCNRCGATGRASGKKLFGDVLLCLGCIDFHLCCL